MRSTAVRSQPGERHKADFCLAQDIHLRVRLENLEALPTTEA